MIEDFGILFDKRTTAQKLLDKINFARKDFLDFIKNKSFRRVVYFIWAKPYMVAGNNTFINEMLKLNNFNNIYENREEHYPVVTIQKMKQAEPELILLSSEPFPFTDKHAFEIEQYIHHAKIIFVDGELFSWYGTRILKAFDYFKILRQNIS